MLRPCFAVVVKVQRLLHLASLAISVVEQEATNKSVAHVQAKAKYLSLSLWTYKYLLVSLIRQF